MIRGAGRATRLNTRGIPHCVVYHAVLDWIVHPEPMASVGRAEFIRCITTTGVADVDTFCAPHELDYRGAACLWYVGVDGHWTRRQCDRARRALRSYCDCDAE